MKINMRFAFIFALNIILSEFQFSFQIYELRKRIRKYFLKALQSLEERIVAASLRQEDLMIFLLIIFMVKGENDSERRTFHI